MKTLHRRFSFFFIPGEHVHICDFQIGDVSFQLESLSIATESLSSSILLNNNKNNTINLNWRITIFSPCLKLYIFISFISYDWVRGRLL